MKNKIVLSIIMPSFKRVELLQYGLESLSKQIITVPYEILLLNDGIEDETRSICNKYKDKLNIRYLFTGQRNIDGKLKWRVPGFAINIGVKQCYGEIILLTTPEIYYVQNDIIDTLAKESLNNHKALVIPSGYDDPWSNLLNHFRKGKDWNSFVEQALTIKPPERLLSKLYTEYPFCIAMKKEELASIGGYDEDLVGYCYDDADLIERLLNNGCFHKKLNNLEIIHLYHKRNNREGVGDRHDRLMFNDKLYNQKKGIIVRNIGRNWGQLDINPSREKEFTKHYNDNLFRGKDSKSGKGSDRDNTFTLEKELIKFLNKMKIKVLVDAPCGDFNWMKHVLPKVKLKYIGIDIVKELIDNNNKLYSNSNTKFIHADLIDHSLPKADLLLCRDCLVHMPYEDIFRFLENFVNSDIEYLLTTTFLYDHRTNVDFRFEVNWMPIHLMKEPFNFPYPQILINEKCKQMNGEYDDKSLGLWSKKEIRKILEKNKWKLAKIPQIAHFYWGSKTLSYLRFLTIKSFRKFNPEWEIRFYYPRRVYTGGQVWNQGFAEQVTGKDYREKIKEIENVKVMEINFDKAGLGYIPDVFRSDVLRLKWLSEEGGLWSDMDVIYFKPMNEICFNNSENSDADTIISYNSVGQHYSIGFLMSSPNNPFYKHLYNKALEKIDRDGEYQHLGIKLWSECFPSPKDIKNYFPQLNLVDIQMWLTYFINSFELTKIIDKNVQLTDPKTIGLHWFGGHPRCPEWESKLTPYNLGQFNNTLCNTIKRAFR